MPTLHIHVHVHNLYSVYHCTRTMCELLPLTGITAAGSQSFVKSIDIITYMYMYMYGTPGRSWPIPTYCIIHAYIYIYISVQFPFYLLVLGKKETQVLYVQAALVENV